MRSICSVENCGRPVVSHGLCAKHHERTPGVRARKNAWQRARVAELRAMNILCSEPGCKQLAVCKLVDNKPTRCTHHASHSAAEERVYQGDWEARRRQELRAMNVPCSIPGCKYPAMRIIVDGRPTLCDTHYGYTAPSNRCADIPLRQQLGTKCAICGYDRLVPHVHRIVWGGPYTLDNCIPLCSNHHDEVHHGLITADELLKYKQSR